MNWKKGRDGLLSQFWKSCCSAESCVSLSSGVGDSETGKAPKRPRTCQSCLGAPGGGLIFSGSSCIHQPPGLFLHSLLHIPCLIQLFRMVSPSQPGFSSHCSKMTLRALMSDAVDSAFWYHFNSNTKRSRETPPMRQRNSYFPAQGFYEESVQF